MSTVTLRNIRKSYGGLEVIHGVDLEIDAGEFVVFVGPSGCGKSTLLRMIAGLETITEGDLKIAEQRMNEVEPAKRGVAMVFQSYALYPHMNVADNMSFAMRLARTAKNIIKEKVNYAAEILQIGQYLDRLPKALSGGQRQRVAIGRAFVREPEVFLFDEPLSNLDAALRVQTRIEIAKLHQKLSATMIFVTHDQVEAMTLADRIVVLRDGLVEQVGSPLELYHTPANRFVAEFIGSPQMNFFDIKVDREKGKSNLQLTPGWGGGSLPLMCDGEGALTLGVRPEHLKIDEAGPIAGRVTLVEQLGEYALVHLDANDGEISVKLSSGGEDMKIGDEIRLGFDPDKAHIFGEDGNAYSFNPQQAA